MYKEGNLTTEKLREAAVAWKDVFEEIPIHVRNSPLATALMASIEPDTVADTKDFERLQLGVRPLLEKNLEFLNDCLDDIVAEQQKVCEFHSCDGCKCSVSCAWFGLVSIIIDYNQHLTTSGDLSSWSTIEGPALVYVQAVPVFELVPWVQVSFYHRNVARQQQQLQQWLQKRRQENATRRLAGEEALPEEDPALFKPIPEPSPLDGFLINNQVQDMSICHHASSQPEKAACRHA